LRVWGNLLPKNPQFHEDFWEGDFKNFPNPDLGFGTFLRDFEILNHSGFGISKSSKNLNSLRFLGAFIKARQKCHFVTFLHIETFKFIQILMEFE
jgi:hypothetical protein